MNESEAQYEKCREKKHLICVWMILNPNTFKHHNHVLTWWIMKEFRQTCIRRTSSNACFLVLLESLFSFLFSRSLPQRIHSSLLTNWEEERQLMTALDLPGQFQSKICLSWSTDCWQPFFPQRAWSCSSHFYCNSSHIIISTNWFGEKYSSQQLGLISCRCSG